MQEINHIFQHFGGSLAPWKDSDKPDTGRPEIRFALSRVLTLPRIFHDFWEIKITLLNFIPERPKRDRRKFL